MSAFGWIWRIAYIVISLALLVYFVVRETSNPIIFGDEAKVDQTVNVVSVVDSEERVRVEIVEVPVVDESARAIQSALEDELFRTREVLAESLAARLEYDVASLQVAYEERGELMRQGRGVIDSVVAELITDTEAIASSTAVTVASIDMQLNELDAAEAEISISLRLLEDAWKGLAAVGEISGEALDERNYDFIDYEVGISETLTDIARKLESEMNLPDIDLATLIPFFNDMDFQRQTMGQRRAPIRLVGNDTLRIPIPKRAGKLLSEQGVNEKLQSQRTMLTRAKSRQANALDALNDEVANLRDVVAEVKGLQQFSEDLQASSTLLDSPDELFFLSDETTPEQREAWLDFNQQFQDLQRAADAEGVQEAQTRLEEATKRLHETYVDAAASDPADDVEWLEGFFEETEDNTPAN